jgi:tRNA modification GTPase
MCAKRAETALEKAVSSVGNDISVCGVMIEEALNALFELSGKNAGETIISEVFKKFCVGK